MKKLTKLIKYLDQIQIVDYLESIGVTSTTNKYHCPFHDDWDASFYVNQEKNICYCFSCGIGGKAGRLILEKIKQEYGLTNIFQAGNKYLDLNPEIRKELDLYSLKENSRTKKEITINEVLDKIDKLQHTKDFTSELEKIKLKPDRKNSSMEDIFKYCIKIQNTDLETVDDLKYID